jgi:hypothetical protein
MPTVDDGRDVDIDDITWPQDVSVWNAVTDHVIDTGAAALGKFANIATVSKTGRLMSMVQGVLMNNLVDGFGGHACFDKRPQMVHQPSVESPGIAH